MSNPLSRALHGRDETRVEIMFSDFTPEAQIELLKACRVTNPSDMNWDTMPVTVLEIDHVELGNSFIDDGNLDTPDLGEAPPEDLREER